MTQRVKSEALSARSRKGWGSTPSTIVANTATVKVNRVRMLGTAIVGPSAAGSLKNISTMTRM